MDGGESPFYTRYVGRITPESPTDRIDRGGSRRGGWSIGSHYFPREVLELNVTERTGLVGRQGG